MAALARIEFCDCLAIGAAAVGVWVRKREVLLAEVHRVSGEVSNLQQWLDSDDTEALRFAITFCYKLRYPLYFPRGRAAWLWALDLILREESSIELLTEY